MKSESNIRKTLEPAYNWIFIRLSQIHESETLEQLHEHLSNMVENIQYLSSLQKTAIKVMKDHLTKFVEQNKQKRHKVTTCPE